MMVSLEATNARLTDTSRCACFCSVLDLFDYTFPENGLIAFKDGKEVSRTSFRDHMGEDRLKTFLNAVLLYLATEVDCPVKRYVNFCHTARQAKHSFESQRHIRGVSLRHA
jgi:hypothetical protein